MTIAYDPYVAQYLTKHAWVELTSTAAYGTLPLTIQKQQEAHVYEHVEPHPQLHTTHEFCQPRYECAL